MKIILGGCFRINVILAVKNVNTSRGVFVNRGEGEWRGKLLWLKNMFSWKGDKFTLRPWYAPE